EIKRALNSGVLPDDYYALAEQTAAGFGPDVLTLQGAGNGAAATADDSDPSPTPLPSKVVLAPPRVQLTAETDLEFLRRKLSTVAVRHVSGDRVIAMVEVVSPGNKASGAPLRAFVEKATELLHKKIHLLILDLLPPGRRDPNGIH